MTSSLPAVTLARISALAAGHCLLMPGRGVASKTITCLCHVCEEHAYKFPHNFYLNQFLDPGNDVSHEVSVDPVDDSGVDIGHQERH